MGRDSFPPPKKENHLGLVLFPTVSRSNFSTPQKKLLTMSDENITAYDVKTKENPATTGSCIFQSAQVNKQYLERLLCA